ncbi:unnamed protein product [Gongylonema pulchrum]|uniref:G_PROTEIN_RECEP_F1_2 domain-containing protein n=1 Tax=Gongylonema pulchrum TaxID=637853 RepID=A0A183ED79_9BILA|nr:unnamed protein product [Gongylonema pulchrum]
MFWVVVPRPNVTGNLTERAAASRFSNISVVPAAVGAVSLANSRSCTEAAEDYYSWIIVLLIVPAVINCCSIALIFVTIVHIRRLKSVTEAIGSRLDNLK